MEYEFVFAFTGSAYARFMVVSLKFSLIWLFMLVIIEFGHLKSFVADCPLYTFEEKPVCFNI